MIKVYKLTDRLTCKINEIELIYSPMTFQQKMECSEFVTSKSGDVNTNDMASLFKALKYSIKDVKGFEYADGSSYELQFDDNGHLTDDCVQELFNTEISPDLVWAAFGMIQGTTGKILNPATGEEVKGVEFIPPKKQSNASKKKTA